jgi:hypothetical protein
MIQDFREENGLPRLNGNYTWRARVAFNNVRFYHSFQIELVPVFRSPLQQRIQVRWIGHDLARGFRSFP